jgi:hypothetical protein
MSTPALALCRTQHRRRPDASHSRLRAAPGRARPWLLPTRTGGQCDPDQRGRVGRVYAVRMNGSSTNSGLSSYSSSGTRRAASGIGIAALGRELDAAAGAAGAEALMSNRAVLAGVQKLGQFRAARRSRRRWPLARVHRDERASASACVLSPPRILTRVKILPTSLSQISLELMSKPEKSWADRAKERIVRAREKQLGRRTQPATRSSQPSPTPSTRASFVRYCSSYRLICSS